MEFDYLIVGAGLFGSIFAYEANKKGKKCLVIDKRSHIAGNIYTENKEEINIHKYGAHIFHTNNKEVWEYMSGFCRFNRFTNSPLARYKNELYNLPFNLNTFSRMFNLVTPQEIEEKLEQEKKVARDKLNGEEISNLEEQAMCLIGKTAYDKLIKGYTQKQWGRECTKLPPFIIKRLPVRLVYDNNYFNALYQGIPIGGYTRIIEKMLDGIEVRLNYNYFEHKDELEKQAKKIIFTGPIDEFYNYRYGRLEYRSLRFEIEELDMPNYQGNAVVNYTDYDIPYTRIIEHKHFEYGEHLGKKDSINKTIITREYPCDYDSKNEPYYTINDEKNNNLYNKYEELASKEKNIIFGGRLGEYKYYDMDQIVESALKLINKELKG